jgi:hypothetical protein
LSSRAKSLSSQRNLGVIYCKTASELLLAYDLTLIKLDNSAAKDRQDIAFSSIVYIELNTKKLHNKTTKANIFES